MAASSQAVVVPTKRRLQAKGPTGEFRLEGPKRFCMALRGTLQYEDARMDGVGSVGELEEEWALDAYEEEVEQQMWAQGGGAYVEDRDDEVGTMGEADADVEVEIEWTLDSDEEEIERALEGIAFGDG